MKELNNPVGLVARQALLLAADEDTLHIANPHDARRERLATLKVVCTIVFACLAGYLPSVLDGVRLKRFAPVS